MQLRSELRRLFNESKGSAGSRALMSIMRELGHQIGWFKVRRLMKEARLKSKQPGAHAYKVPGLNDQTSRICWRVNLLPRNPIRCGVATLLTCGRVAAGIT